MYDPRPTHPPMSLFGRKQLDARVDLEAAEAKRRRNEAVAAERKRIKEHNDAWRAQLSPDAARAYRLVESAIGLVMYGHGGAVTSKSYTDVAIQALIDGGFLWATDKKEEDVL